jgi:hypothetical protein
MRSPVSIRNEENLSMKRTRPALVICGFLGAICTVLIAFVPCTWGLSGTITGVRLAPDSSSVAVLYQGQVAKPSAVVMGHPYRLVLDFESSDLGKVGTKIPGKREPIKQVRLGHANARTRVVVDFGENPVPPFQIVHSAGQVTVTFGNRLCQSRDSFDEPAASSAKPRNQGETAGRVASLRAAKKLPLAVKTSEFQNNVVVVELKDARDPKQLYRLELDVDYGSSTVRRATLTETSSRVRSVSERLGIAAPGLKRDTEEIQEGSVAKPADGTTPSTEIRKFTWGTAAAADTSQSKPEPGGKNGLKVERYTPSVQQQNSEDEWDKLRPRKRP